MTKKALVIYDSFFGNTEKIARAIDEGLKPLGKVDLMRADAFSPKSPVDVDLLIVGSPTRKFTASPATINLIKRIPAKGLAGVRAAAFDTRVSMSDIKSAFLRLLIHVGGYAADPIAKRLKAKGAGEAATPMGFLVNGTEGPLKEGEVERARLWAKQLPLRRVDSHTE